MAAISVIIPIYNAECFLNDLFGAIEKNEFEDQDEVLLIDNGSTDKSLELCYGRRDLFPNLYKVFSFTEKASSYAARNYGVKLAKGQILVFTDSDTKPVSNWLKIIRNSIRTGEVIAGKIYLDNIDNGLWETFDQIAHLNSEKNAINNCVATANMAVTKHDFLKVGLFEERFSGGDYEWSQRAVKNGLNILFIPEAMVHHPTRKSFEQILKKEQRIAFGTGNHYRLHNKSKVLLIIKYVLKIFKLDTNLRYSKRLLLNGIRRADLLEFNMKFMQIRLSQLIYAIKGYNLLNARKIGIK